MELIHQQFGTIRVAESKGQYWFCTKDICDALELENVSMALQKLDDDEKGMKNFDTPGGPQWMLVVNESGLYTLVLRSNKPQARAFRKWVTNEVLPTLRRTGRYEVKTSREVERDNERAYRNLLRELAGEVLLSDMVILSRRTRLGEDVLRGVLSGRVKNAVVLNEIYLYVLRKKGLERFYHNAADMALRVLTGGLTFEKLTELMEQRIKGIEG